MVVWSSGPIIIWLMTFIDCYAYVFTITLFMGNGTSFMDVLNGSNFKQWMQDFDFIMGSMDYEMSLTVNEPNEPAEDSSSQEKIKYLRWVKDNKMCM